MRQSVQANHLNDLFFVTCENICRFIDLMIYKLCYLTEEIEKGKEYTYMFYQKCISLNFIY